MDCDDSEDDDDTDEVDVDDVNDDGDDEDGFGERIRASGPGSGHLGSWSRLSLSPFPLAYSLLVLVSPRLASISASVFILVLLGVSLTTFLLFRF